MARAVKEKPEREAKKFHLTKTPPEEAALTRSVTTIMDRVEDVAQSWLDLSGPQPTRVQEIRAARLALAAELKQIETQRRSLTDKLNYVVKILNNLARPAKDRIKFIDDHLASLLQATLEQEQRAKQKALAARARAAEKKGALQLAEDIRSEGANVDLGVPTLETYVAEVTDKVAFIKWVANSPAPDELAIFLDVDLGELTAAKTKFDVSPPPGIVFTKRTTFIRK